MNTINKIICLALGVCIVLLLTHCKQNPKPMIATDLQLPSKENFDKHIHTKQVQLYTLHNKNGLRTDITNFGGRIVTLLVPDKNGILDDIVTGYHHIDDYLKTEEVYFGALIGRYGNRIAKAEFTINGQTYNLNANNGPNHLHGGPTRLS